MDFLPSLIHGTIELMFLDPLPSILLDQTHIQFALTFCMELQFERPSQLFGLPCGTRVCVCVDSFLWADSSNTDIRAPLLPS